MAGANRRDLEQYTNSLARYLPGGCLFASKGVDGSTFRKLLRGMSGELFRANGLIKEYCEQILPDETVKFIEEWESALGIPDECLFGNGTLDERRRDILVKLASSGIQTAQDFIDFAALFGIVVTIRNGIANGAFPMTFPIILFNSSKDARFTIIVTFNVAAGEEFPYTFPLPFGNNEIVVLECLFNNLKPANCDVIFEQV